MEKYIYIKNNKVNSPFPLTITKVYVGDNLIGYTSSFDEITYRRIHQGSNHWDVIKADLYDGYRVANPTEVSTIWKPKMATKVLTVGRYNGEDIDITIVDTQSRAVDFFFEEMDPFKDAVEMFEFFSKKKSKTNPYAYAWDKAVKDDQQDCPVKILYPYSSSEEGAIRSCSLNGGEFFYLAYWDGEMIQHVYYNTKTMETKRLRCYWDQSFSNKEDILKLIQEQEGTSCVFSSDEVVTRKRVAKKKTKEDSFIDEAPAIESF